ncbi:hypothetical protein Tco_0343013, partial [Tanacetum coccineum]
PLVVLVVSIGVSVLVLIVVTVVVVVTVVEVVVVVSLLIPPWKFSHFLFLLSASLSALALTFYSIKVCAIRTALFIVVGSDDVTSPLIFSDNPRI